MRHGSLAQLPDSSLAELVHRLPKPDLHCHLEGALTPEMIIDLATKFGLTLPTYDVDELRPLVQVTAEDSTLLDFLKKFDVIGTLFVSEQVIEEMSRAVVHGAAKDNVCHLELRFSPMYMANSGGLDPSAIVGSVLEGIRRGTEETGLTVSLIMIIERQMGMEKAWEVARLAERFGRDRIQALDLANDEYNFPPRPFAPVFQHAKDQGFKVVVHAGEAGPPENIAVAVRELGADRGGHFVRAYLDDSVEALLAERSIPLELCRTSNEQTGAVPSTEEYPLRRYLDRGLVVTINTDDPGISGITLSDEYFRVIRESDLTYSEVVGLIHNGIRSAFLPEKARNELLAKVDLQLEEIFRTVPTWEE